MRKIYRLTEILKSFIRWKEANKQKIEAMVNSENHTGNTIWSFLGILKKFTKNSSQLLFKIKDTSVVIVVKGYFQIYILRLNMLNQKNRKKKLTLDFDNLLASCDGGSNHRCHLVKKGETLISIADLYGVDVEHLEEVYIKIDEIEVLEKV